MNRFKSLLFIFSFGCTLGAIALLIRPNAKQLGILQMDSFQYEASERELLEAYQKNPYDLLTLSSLSRIYEILGKPQQEIRYLNEYIALRPKDTAKRLHLAKVYLWNLQQKAALEQYLSIIAYEPENVEVLRHLATSFTWEQMPHKAIDCYKSISKLGALSQEDLRALVQLYISVTELDSALALMEKLHRSHESPLSIIDYITLADLYSWTGRPALADSTMARMLEELNAAWEVRLSFVDWYLGIARSDRALFWLERWSRRPDDMQLISHEKLVEVYQLELKEFEAIASMERLVTHPDAKQEHQTQLFWMYIDAIEEQKAWELGRQFNDEVIEKERLFHPLSILATQLGQVEQAERWLRIILERNPNDHEARQTLFTLYKDQGKVKEAVTELTWLLQHDGDNPVYLQMAVYYFLELDRFEEALQFAERGREGASNQDSHRQTMFLKAIIDCCHQMEKWEEALNASTELLVLSSNDFDLHLLHLGAMAQLKQKATGLQHIDNIWPQFTEIEEQAAALADATGWFEDYPTQFWRYNDLEARLEGAQYEEAHLKAAMGAEFYAWALPVLEHRLDFGLLDQLDFERLNNVYSGLKFYEKELALLDQFGKAYMVELDQLKRKSELLFNLKRSSEAITVFEEAYVRLSPDSEVMRIELMEKVLWVEDLDLQQEIIARHGDLTGPDGLILASIYLQQNKPKRASTLLSGVQPRHLKTLEAQKIVYDLSSIMDDKKGMIRAILNIINQENDSERLTSWHVELASLYHQTGKVEEAANLCRNILSQYPKNQQAQVILAYTYYDNKKFRIAADLIKKSGSDVLHDRFLRGASLLRFEAGYREGVRVFNRLLHEFRKEESFEKWNLVLDIGYELNSPFYIERAWENILKKYPNPDVMPRYALHLLYTDRRIRAEEIYRSLPPSQEPSYIALLKIFDPLKFKGPLSAHERIALADFSERGGFWLEATQWLP